METRTLREGQGNLDDRSVREQESGGKGKIIGYTLPSSHNLVAEENLITDLPFFESVICFLHYFDRNTRIRHFISSLPDRRKSTSDSSF